MGKTEDKKEIKPHWSSPWLVIGIPVVLLLVLLAAVLAFMTNKDSNKPPDSQSAANQTEPDKPEPPTYKDVYDPELRAANNEGWGLPADFPSHIVPFYEGATLTETETGETESADGQPMDWWLFRAEVDGEPKPVYEYYRGLMEELDMQQMLYTSIPKGYGFHYANDRYLCEFEVEKPKSSDTFTRIFVTVYRIRDNQPVDEEPVTSDQPA